jgi:hypothetical protein
MNCRRGRGGRRPGPASLKSKVKGRRSAVGGSRAHTRPPEFGELSRVKLASRITRRGGRRVGEPKLQSPHPASPLRSGRARMKERRQKGGRFCHLISARQAGGEEIPGGNEIWIPAGDGDPFFNRTKGSPAPLGAAAGARFLNRRELRQPRSVANAFAPLGYLCCLLCNPEPKYFPSCLHGRRNSVSASFTGRGRLEDGAPPSVEETARSGSSRYARPGGQGWATGIGTGLRHWDGTGKAPSPQPLYVETHRINRSDGDGCGKACGA